MLWIFQLPEKSSDFGRGSNPRTRVPEASMLTIEAAHGIALPFYVLVKAYF
jgi:hypothetical protein